MPTAPVYERRFRLCALLFEVYLSLYLQHLDRIENYGLWTLPPWAKEYERLATEVGLQWRNGKAQQIGYSITCAVRNVEVVQILADEHDLGHIRHEIEPDAFEAKV